MIRRRRKLTADENDVHGPWRHVLTSYQRPGKAAAVKRATNRRERREAAGDIAEQMKDTA